MSYEENEVCCAYHTGFEEDMKNRIFLSYFPIISNPTHISIFISLTILRKKYILYIKQPSLVNIHFHYSSHP